MATLCDKYGRAICMVNVVGEPMYSSDWPWVTLEQAQQIASIDYEAFSITFNEAGAVVAPIGLGQDHQTSSSPEPGPAPTPTPTPQIDLLAAARDDAALDLGMGPIRLPDTLDSILNGPPIVDPSWRPTDPNTPVLESSYGPQIPYITPDPDASMIDMLRTNDIGIVIQTPLISVGIGTQSGLTANESLGSTLIGAGITHDTADAVSSNGIGYGDISVTTNGTVTYGPSINLPLGGFSGSTDLLHGTNNMVPMNNGDLDPVNIDMLINPPSLVDPGWQPDSAPSTIIETQFGPQTFNIYSGENWPDIGNADVNLISGIDSEYIDQKTSSFGDVSLAGEGYTGNTSQYLTTDTDIMLSPPGDFVALPRHWYDWLSS
ncbi:hypothetical protein OPKNFCMD_5472 [Methylobacterium crusticola]|uniref:Uncharacterized protein n=1 Tax=Methylobacterium crusticola TaxID=1697972 RepID=A0ABQ4R5W8_9HYPH|nr:hypothetical protein [Methylobacterium crusticola]GJD52706.1 hypothetical protein OPKNFCMD_5472 [Methylobacterium crusticola]